jgi:phosphatidylcholine synthase
MQPSAAKRSSIGRSWGSRGAAWAVHMYTASGALFAFAGAWGVLRGNTRLALAAMFAATMVDATDGMLARRVGVKQVLPGVDGGRIDDIVDYITFVFLPLLLLAGSGGLAPAARFPIAGIVLLSSMYGFVAPDAKTSDYFFTGFPSYWNVVVLYLLLFHVTPAANAAILVALSGLIFVRTRYVYPSRTPVLQTLTLVLGGLWGAAIAILIALWGSPPRMLAIASLGFPVYYTVLSVILHARHRLPPEGGSYGTKRDAL